MGAFQRARLRSPIPSSETPASPATDGSGTELITVDEKPQSPVFVKLSCAVGTCTSSHRWPVQFANWNVAGSTSPSVDSITLLNRKVIVFPYSSDAQANPFPPPWKFQANIPSAVRETGPLGPTVIAPAAAFTYARLSP